MKKLDNKNKTYLNYSTEDGKNAQDILRDKIILKQKSVCGHCEAENNEGLYCKSCGKSLDEVETSKKGKNIKAFKGDIKPILLTSVTSVAILKDIFPIIHPFRFILSVPRINSLKVFVELSLEEIINASAGIFTVPITKISSPSLYAISIAKSPKYFDIESVGVNNKEWEDFISTSITEVSSLYDV